MQNIQTILNFSKKKFKFFGNAAAAAFLIVLLLSYNNSQNKQLTTCLTRKTKDQNQD
jgi:hypothetical protein